jgi:hypothetical protein
MLRILFLGLCMFVREGKGREVVLPALPNGVTIVTPCTPTHVEGHMAYISAAAADVKECEACEVAGDRKRLRLDGDTLTIDGITSTTYTEDPTFKTLIPSLEKICDAFKPSIPDTATTLNVTLGTLTAERLPTGLRRSTLAIETGGDITFTARRGKMTRTMVLKAGTTDVTIGNEGLSAVGGTQTLAENHWLAFYALSATPVSCSLPIDIPDVQTTIACSNSQYP